MKANDLIQLGLALGSIDNLDDLKKEISTVIHSIGFEFYSVVAHNFKGFTKEEVFFMHNYPDEWKDHYFSNNYFEIDPANDAASSDQPIFKWTAAAESEVIRAASDFGICSGITIPIIEPGSPGFVSYASRDKTMEDEMEIAAYFASPYIYGATVNIIKFGAFNEEYSLTKREVECLKWVSDGKTSWEVSVILSISERTVLFHLTNIQKKLNTTNRLQSVAKSIVMGLITP